MGRSHFGSRLKACVHFNPSIAMTTKATKATIKAAKKAAGKKAKSASAKKNAMAMKKAGKGIFAPKKLSDALAAICGAKSLPRTEVTKKIWAYIKSRKLNEGRSIKPVSGDHERAPAMQPKSSDSAPGSRVATSRVR